MDKENKNEQQQQQLPNPTISAQKKKQPGGQRRTIVSLASLTLLAVGLVHRASPNGFFRACHNRLAVSSLKKDEAVCYQPPILFPVDNQEHYDTLTALYQTEEYLHKAVEWLGGAVRVPTESYDDNGAVGVDPRWDVFADLHAYFKKAFPRTFSTLTVEAVDTYGLVLTWEGSDKTLKPLLLMGHQDVVPVLESTVDAWNYPPYSGHWDGEFVWGRGSCDDKAGLIGILSTIETILTETSFTPRRTLVVGSGIDEESSGNSFMRIGRFLESKFGTNSFAMVVDEGSGYAHLADGTGLAAPATGEKGNSPIEVKVDTLGGHSSVPPEHTSIGVLSLLIAKLESTPHKPQLTRENPFYSTLTCSAKYSLNDLSPEIRSLIEKSQYSDKALDTLGSVLAKDRTQRYLFTTSEAVTIIGGGVKVNALPESASAIVDHRINVASSSKELAKQFTSRLLPLIKDLNFTLTAFGEDLIARSSSPSAGHITLGPAWGGKPLDPAPVTPIGKGVKGWDLLSGSIKATWGGEDIIVAPSLSTGNTDTKAVWNLTNQIYRFSFTSEEDFFIESGMHSVNEAMRGTGFVKGIKFFTTLIFNADEYDL